MKFWIDHIGIAVENLSESISLYEALGFSEHSKETVDSEKVKVAMFPLENDSQIELLEASADESAVAKFLQKRGPGIHHICLRVENIHEALKQLKDRGVKLINEEPKLGAHNCLVAFIHPKSTGGVLIELSQPQESNL